MPRDLTSPSKRTPSKTPYSKPGPSSPSKAAPPASSSSTPSYALSFGKHNGTPLSSLDRGYLSWIISKTIYENKPDLKAALISEGFMLEDGSPGANKAPPSSSPRKVGAAGSVSAPAGWKLPSRAQAKEFVEFDGADTWISSYDVFKQFGISTALPTASRLHPYPGGGSTKRWYLWEVFALSKHLPELKAKGFTPGRSAASFAQKNQERTEDIWASMGLGACLCNDDDGY